MQIKDQVIQTIKNGKIGGSWIVSGPFGVGKKTLAKCLTNYLLTGQWNDDLGYHANVKWVEKSLTETAKKEVQKLILAGKEVVDNEKTTATKNEITVDDVRDAIRFLSLKAGSGEYRILIVSLADDMNENASNALLKVLEEPNERNIIILLTENMGKLLPTIKSRCRCLSIKPLSQDEMVAYINTHIKNCVDPVLLAELSKGSMGLAHLIDEEKGLNIYQKITAFSLPISQLDIAQVDAFADSLKNNDKAYYLFTLFFITHLSDLAKDNFYQQKVLSEFALNLYDETITLFYKTDSLYLDKKQVVMSLIFKLAEGLS